jgi:SAM-dependent methyltransferase
MNIENTTEKSGFLYDFLDLPLIYNLVQFSLRKYNTHKRLFNDLISLNYDVVVLDCGCGPGTYRNFITSENYIGIDINEKHILKAKSKFPQDTFIVEDLLNIQKLELKQFDAAILIGILHHLPDRLCSEMLKTILNKLSPNGKVFSLDPVYIDNQRTFAKFLASKDKGNFVRKPIAYDKLIPEGFNHDNKIISNLLRVPFDHYFMKLQKK